MCAICVVWAKGYSTLGFRLSSALWLFIHTRPLLASVSPHKIPKRDHTVRCVRCCDHISRDAISFSRDTRRPGPMEAPPYNPLLQRPPHMFEI